jgi:hypothetical protein
MDVIHFLHCYQHHISGPQAPRSTNMLFLLLLVRLNVVNRALHKHCQFVVEHGVSQALWCSVKGGVEAIICIYRTGPWSKKMFRAYANSKSFVCLQCARSISEFDPWILDDYSNPIVCRLSPRQCAVVETFDRLCLNCSTSGVRPLVRLPRRARSLLCFHKSVNFVTQEKYMRALCTSLKFMMNSFGVKPCEHVGDIYVYESNAYCHPDDRAKYEEFFMKE